MKNMTIEAMLRVTGGRLYLPEFCEEEIAYDKEITMVTIDSRTIEAGGMFVAVVGARSDGHDYVNSCFDKGAYVAICEHSIPEAKGPVIVVESSLTALKQLARFYREQLDIKVVGITGSVGKTSTKETIAAVLEQGYKVLKTDKNFNNEIGLPLTIFRIRDEHEVAVLEMGISDFGEMSRLTAMAQPDICVITNIGQCHLEQLKTRDGILKAKTEIFEGLREGGTVILNGDDDKLITVQEVAGVRPVFFGMNSALDIWAKDIDNRGLLGVGAVLMGLSDDELRIDIGVPGIHMVYNAMAAAAVGKVLKLTSAQIAAGISNMKTIAGRNNIIKTENYVIIDDCYNANPVSMKASIDVLSGAKGRRVCILGDMFELGADEVALHESVGVHIASCNPELLITVGTLAANIAKAARANAASSEIITFEDRESAIEGLSSILQPGDNILVKASHGMGFDRIVASLVS